MQKSDLIAAAAQDALRPTTVMGITFSLRLDPSGADWDEVARRDLAQAEPIYFPNLKRALRQAGLAGLGLTEQQEVQAGITVAQVGLAAVPLVGPILSALTGIFGGLFGGDGELGPVTPGVINPATGEGVHCGKPDETERTAALARGDFGWILARMPGQNFYALPTGGKAALPFPDASPDNLNLVKANIMAYLAQANPGQCPAMTNVAREWLKINIPRLTAKPGIFGAGVFGLPSWALPVAVVGVGAYFILPKVFGKRKYRRNPVGGMSDLLIPLAIGAATFMAKKKEPVTASSVSAQVPVPSTPASRVAAILAQPAPTSAPAKPYSPWIQYDYSAS